MQSNLQRWEGQGTTTFNWINQEKDKQVTAVTRSCNSRAHLTESVSWKTIQDAVAKVKRDQEEEEQRLMGKVPLADVEPATVEEAGLNEFTLKLPGMASAKLPESTKSAAVSNSESWGTGARQMELQLYYEQAEQADPRKTRKNQVMAQARHQRRGK